MRISLVVILFVASAAEAVSHLPGLDLNSPSTDLPWWIREMMARHANEEEVRLAYEKEKKQQEEESSASVSIPGIEVDLTDPVDILRGVSFLNEKVTTLMDVYDEQKNTRPVRGTR